jgi:hypothetical protein
VRAYSRSPQGALRYTSPRSPFRSPQFIEDARSGSTESYPVVLMTHKSGLVAYMEGSDPNLYVPGRVPNDVGDPQQYLEVALREAISAKQNANSLDIHRPNLVAVNYALSMDFQLAMHRAGDIGVTLPAVELSSSVDALAVATTGIDERLTRSGLRRIAPLTPARAALERIMCAT